MADPGTIALIGMGASAAGGITGAISSIMGGEAQAKAFRYQAGVAKINEQIAKQNAEWSRRVGEVEAQKAGMKSRTDIGVTKATQSGSGIDVNSGSAARVRESEQEIGQQNEAIIRSSAAHRAYGHEVEAVGHGAQAGMFEMAESRSKTAAKLGVASSILGGATSVASKWLTYKSTFGTENETLGGESGGGYE